MDHPESNSVVCVLGMHRSGTSCLVGSLQKAGLHLGRHHTWNKYNRKGNRENQDIVDLNDAVLAHNDGAWDRPPARLRYTPQHLLQATAIADSFPQHCRWGFKDPRLLLTLPMWREALGDRCQRAGIFRHPLAVAHSLGYRGGPAIMPEERALQLWAKYNRRLLDEHQRDPFPVLCFDWDEELFHEKLHRVHDTLALPRLAAGERFYNGDLKNYGSEDIAIIPRKYRPIYKKLCAITL